MQTTGEGRAGECGGNAAREQEYFKEHGSNSAKLEERKAYPHEDEGGKAREEDGAYQEGSSGHSETSSSVEELDGIEEGKMRAETRQAAGKKTRRGRRGGWRERFSRKGGEDAERPSLVVWNARGLMVKKGHKHLELALLAAETQPLVIAITESHLDSSFEDGEVHIPGYVLIRSDRDPVQSEKKKGGGVAVFIREEVGIEEVTKKAGPDFELVAFTMPGGTRYVIMYRPPGSSISEEALMTVEKEYAGKQKRLLAGDLNMNTKAETPIPRALRRLLEAELKMHQRVEFITRHRGKQGTTIDHVWTNMPCRCRPQKELDGLSDHRAIRAIHAQGGEAAEEQPTSYQKRFWEKASDDDMVAIIKEGIGAMVAGLRQTRKCTDKAQAEAEMRRHGVGVHYELDDTMEAWDKAWDKIKTVVAPLTKVKVKPRRRTAKWFTKDVKDGIRHRVEQEEHVRALEERGNARRQERRSEGPGSGNADQRSERVERQGGGNAEQQREHRKRAAAETQRRSRSRSWSWRRPGRSSGGLRRAWRGAWSGRREHTSRKSERNCRRGVSQTGRRAGSCTTASWQGSGKAQQSRRVRRTK